jgi:hypothetical protein
MSTIILGVRLWPIRWRFVITTTIAVVWHLCRLGVGIVATLIMAARPDIMSHLTGDGTRAVFSLYRITTAQLRSDIIIVVIVMFVITEMGHVITGLFPERPR